MKRLMTFIGLLLSGLLLWLAVKDTNFHQIRLAFAGANPAYVIPILAALAGFYLLKAARWSDILSPSVTLGVRKLIPSMMSGAAGNNLLPAHLGEIVRVYLLSREYGLSKANVLGSLLVERVFDVVSVLLLLSITLVLADLPPQLAPAILLLVIVAIGGTVVMYMLGKYADRLVDFVGARVECLPMRIGTRISDFVINIATGFGAIRNGRLFLRIFVNSVVQWSLMAGCIHFALHAFLADVPLVAAIVVLAIIVAGLALPTSPGFVGTIQFCFILGLKPFGVDASEALAVSVYYHTVLWTAVTITGLVFLHRYRLSFAEIRTLEQHDRGSAVPTGTTGS